MGNNLRVAADSSHTRLFESHVSRAVATAQVPRVHSVRGRAAVIALQSLLVELSERTGQTGAMDAIDVFLGAPTAIQKTPYLLLVGLRDGVIPEAAGANDLDGAVLIYEYRVAGRGTSVFATDDVTGARTVIAPERIRTEIAELACRKLLELGAAMAMITLEGETVAGRRSVPGRWAACRMATRLRMVPKYLPLADTLDATLATLGNDTRRNFRRYRRRLEVEFGAEFVSMVEMGREEFLELNRASTNPVAEAVAIWRYESLAQIARPMFCGLRAADGQWLSLIGGRRQGGATEIDWQINLAGMARYSLSTAMRAFLLEHEVELGTDRLVFEGGTPHPMRHSFVASNAVDIVVVRVGSPVAWMLSRISRWVLPAKNFLGAALRDPELNWTGW
jgi:hypothetical protein